MNDHVNTLLAATLGAFAAMVRSVPMRAPDHAPLIPSHVCPACGTEYYAPGKCDWCEDMKVVEIAQP